MSDRKIFTVVTITNNGMLVRLAGAFTACLMKFSRCQY